MNVFERSKGIAGIWGFAEATLFFIVPDVWISMVAVNGLRKGVVCCLYALMGALLGGALMYILGISAMKPLLSLFDLLPAISSEMLDRVGEELKQDGVMAVLLGPTSGTPYKIYAVRAAQAGMGAGAFLAITIPARLIRFLLCALAAWLIGRALHKMEERTRIKWVAGVWCAGYAAYFALMPN